MTTVVLAVAALLTTVLVTPIVIVVARRTGTVDRPGPLKPQTAPVPYLGGLAVLAGLSIGALIGRPGVLVPLVGATALGALDDRASLSARWRLVGECVVGVAVVVTCPVGAPAVPGAVLLILVTVWLMNGVNLLDGLDMLASGVAAAAAVGFAVVLAGPAQRLAVATAAALVGFIVFNRPPARIYLGDAGAYLLGATLAVLLAEAWRPGVGASTGVAALTLVAIPAAEAVFAVLRRARGRRPLLAGDRGHPYDRLVARGWPPPAASLAYLGVAVVLTSLSVAAAGRSSVVPAVTVAVGTAAVLSVLAALSGGLTPDPPPA